MVVLMLVAKWGTRRCHVEEQIGQAEKTAEEQLSNHGQLELVAIDKVELDGSKDARVAVYGDGQQDFDLEHHRYLNEKEHEFACHVVSGVHWRREAPIRRPQGSSGRRGRERCTGAGADAGTSAGTGA